MQQLRQELKSLKQLVTDLSLADLTLKKAHTRAARTKRYGRMRPEKKREVIESVRRSPTPKKLALAELGLASSTKTHRHNQYIDQAQLGPGISWH